MDIREQRSVILHLLGFGTVEARWHAIEASMALANERAKIKVASMVVPVAVWSALIITASALIIGAFRAVRAVTSDGDEDDEEMIAAVSETTDGEPAPVALA
jgi:hypothetical protein